MPKKINKIMSVTYMSPIATMSSKVPYPPIIPIGIPLRPYPSISKTVQVRRSSNYYSSLPYNKFNLPHGVLVQNVNNRHSKVCKTCDKKPEGKRLLVLYFHPLNHRVSTTVYCQDCAKEFLRECDKDYNSLVSEIYDAFKK